MSRRFFVLAVAALLISVLAVLGSPEHGSAGALVVNLATDVGVSDTDPGDGVCDSDNSTEGSQCALRTAIEEANASAGLDLIVFDATVFPSGAPATISPLTQMLASMDPAGLTIDGSGAGVIVDGSGLGAGEEGLTFHTITNVGLTDVTVSDITVQNFPGDGILVCGGDVTTCEDAVSETTISGVTVNGNGDEGVEVIGGFVSNTLIEDCEANGNTENGVTVNGKEGTTDPRVENCTASNNGSRGINLFASLIDQVLSGATVIDVVANGNGNRGINLNASGNNVNSTVLGSTTNGNGSQGININAGDSTIGPTVSGSTASGNSSTGIILNGGAPSSEATVTGNTSTGNTGNGIETDASGTYSDNAFSDNDGDGFEGRELGIVLVGNTISGNMEHAIDGFNDGGMTITDNTITGNMSAASAVRIPGTNNVVSDNTISNNAGDGIDNGFGGAGSSTITDNTVIGNAGDGIAAGPDGGNTITSNLVSGSGDLGIRAPGAGNIVSGNSAVGNAAEGIVVSSADAQVHFNRLSGNAVGLEHTGAGMLDAQHNWWGCNEGPTDGSCDSAEGDIDFDPWLVLEAFAEPAETTPFVNTTVFATLTETSNGGGGAEIPDHILDGTLITFETDFGDLSGNPAVRPTSAGVAETPFGADQAGIANIEVTLDNETVNTTVEVIAGSPTSTSTPTGTNGPTPTATPTPTPTPTGSPVPGALQGDVDCDGDVDAVDALKILQLVAGLPFGQEDGCPPIGEPFGDQLFGDVDCDGDVDAVDALKILQFIAAVPFGQMEPCADVGMPLA